MWCAYLRTPYTEPAEQPAEGTAHERLTEYQERVQEREVRNAAQRLLEAHLHPRSDVFWEEIDIDLSGATLINFNLDACRLGAATFVGARFPIVARFRGTQFAIPPSFSDTEFQYLAPRKWRPWSWAPPARVSRILRARSTPEDPQGLHRVPSAGSSRSVRYFAPAPSTHSLPCRNTVC